MARTTHRSVKGKKLYAKRNKQGQFTDIQQYRRSANLDLLHRSKAEKKARAKKHRKANAKGA